MTRTAALLVIVLALPARAQEDEAALAKGQKYLDKIAKGWSAKLPQERLCGIYIGRQWVGSFTLTLTAVPDGGPAAYEMTMKGDLKAAGHAMTMESRGLFTRGLGPVSSETTEKDGVARIQLFGQQTWKLFEVKEGAKKGQWFIFGIEQ